MTLFREEVRSARANRLHGEIVLRQHNSHILLAALLIIVAIAATLWLSLSHFARIETVPGILTTTSPTAKVFPMRPGVVTALQVREGSEVRAGQTLVTVNADVRDHAGMATAAGSAASVQDQLRLAEGQFALLDRAQSVESARVHERVTSSERQIQALQEQLRVQEEIVASQKRLFEGIQGVAERGFISRVEFERRRQSYLSAKQAALQIEQQIVSLNSQIAQARSDLQNANVTYSRELAAVRSNMESLRQQHFQFTGAQSFILSAPISGRVTALQTGLGQVVQPVTPLFSIVPTGSELRAEIYAPTRAIGMVEIGQEATLALDAFPYQRFGTTKGRVEAISRTVLAPDETAAPLDIREPVYKIIIALDSQSMMARGGEHALQPGMTLKANIVLERQTFLEWLLSPLTAVARRT